MLLTVGLAVAGAVVGAIVTVIVGLYFYRRGLRHSLSLYTLGTSEPFAEIDPAIRQELKMEFRERDVKDLTEIYLLCANDGVSAISNYKEPLTFSLPEGASLIDASISYISPETPTMHLEKADDHFSVEFPVFNSNKFFILKALVNGKISYSKLACTIIADNLPPTLKINDNAKITVGEKPERNYDDVVAGIVAVLAGGAVAWVLHLLITLAAPVNPLNVIAGILTGICGLLVLMSGIAAIVFDGIPAIRPRRHFSMPEELKEHVYPYHRKKSSYQ